MKTKILALNGACDYVLSSRLAAIRVMASDASAAANQAVIIKKLQAVAANFEKPCLIVEKDRGNIQDTVSRSKTLNHLSFLVFSSKAQCTVLYSDGQKESAELLKQLAATESRKGKSLTKSDSKANSLQDQLGLKKFQFLQSLQGVPPAAAANFIARYPNLRHTLTSTASDLATRGQLPPPRANKVAAIFKKRVNAMDIFD